MTAAEALERLRGHRDAAAATADDALTREIREEAGRDATALSMAVEAMEGERAQHLALRNVRALAQRLRKTDPENAAHFLRFCDEVGVSERILRDEEYSR